MQHPAIQHPASGKESEEAKLAGTGSVFHVHDVSRIYRMGEVEVHALRDVTVDLYQGEFAVLLGASGSGKSTLLNILGGLDRPISGAVYYRDHNLTRADDDGLTRFRREHVGFIFQFYNLSRASPRSRTSRWLFEPEINTSLTGMTWD